MEPYVRFFGGIRGIGGNKILVMASNGKGILLDFGLDFGLNKQYFDEFMKARDKQILLDGTTTGMIPWPVGDLKGLYRPDLCKLNREWTLWAYEQYQKKTGDTNELDLDSIPDVTEVLISHAHLDNVGDIKYLHPSIKLVCSETTKTILERLDVLGGSSSAFNNIIAYKEVGLIKPEDEIEVEKSPRVAPVKIPDTHREILTLQENQWIECAQGGLKIQFIETDHSIPGAGAFLIEDVATNKHLIYTGDIRQHGPQGKNTLKFIKLAKAFKPDLLITEGTRLTPDRKPDSGENPVIDERKYELENEQSVKQHIIEFLKKAQANDPSKLMIFDCSGRDLWRIGSFYQAAASIERTLIIEPKIYDLIKHLDPTGEKYGVNIENVRVYIPRKDWGLYEYDDYDTSAAIKEILKLPENRLDAALDAFNADLKEQFEQKQAAKIASYEEKMREWEAAGKPSPKPRKPSDKEFNPKTIEEVKDRILFWADAPFKITAKEIHQNQSQYLLYLSNYTLNELFDIAPHPGAFYIQSNSGPFDEEGKLDLKRRNAWFEMFGISEDEIHFGHFHCSGHMRSEELFTMVESIAAPSVALVHSEGKEEFQAHLKDKCKVILPKLEEKIYF